MKRILHSLPALACLLFSSVAFSQNSTSANIIGSSACDAVVEDFTTDPSSRGFSLSGYQYSGPQTSGQNLWIQSVQSNTDYIITTPTYFLTTGGSVRMGFTMSTTTGSNNYFQPGNTFDLLTEVLSSDGLTTLATASFTISAAGIYCIQLNDADLISGTAIRYNIRFTSSAGVTGTRIIQFDNLSTGANQQIILPVVFTSFTAKKYTTHNALTWNVTGELNVERYDVERSGNGKVYNVIGNVIASQKITYAHSDLVPLTGSNYYRIKSVDIDGKFKYSPVVQIKSSTKPAIMLSAYPSPATSTVIIEHDGYVAGTGLQISGVDGRIIKNIIPAKGVQQTQVNVSSLTAGLYFIRYENNNGEVETVKVIKQ